VCLTILSKYANICIGTGINIFHITEEVKMYSNEVLMIVFGLIALVLMFYSGKFDENKEVGKNDTYSALCFLLSLICFALAVLCFFANKGLPATDTFPNHLDLGQSYSIISSVKTKVGIIVLIKKTGCGDDCSPRAYAIEGKEPPRVFIKTTDGKYISMVE